MVDSHAFKSADKSYNNGDINWDVHKIQDYVMSKSIAYDGKCMSWCDGFETLQDFIKVALGFEGKWRSYGGSSKRFDAKTHDFAAIWYPGKLNTLTLSGLVGTEAKEYLINLCVHPSIGGPEKRVENFSRADLSESIESVLLEIEILKSRVDSVQSVIMCADQPLPTAANLSSEITHLQIDLEDEKLKRCVLELQVNRLEEELNIFKSYRNNYTIQSTSSTNVNDGIVEDSVEVINPRATSHAFSNNDTIEILHIDESANALENSLCHQQIANGYELSQGANLIESVEEWIGKLPLIETSKSSVNVANKMSTQSSAHRVKDSSQVNRLTERLPEVGLYDNITQQKGKLKQNVS